MIDSIGYRCKFMKNNFPNQELQFFSYFRSFNE